MTPPRIAIIGAGPGGLTLARVLHTRGLAATVYELDAGPTARDQGGTLDLDEESGQLALGHAGLLAGFRERSRPEGGELRLVAADGTVARHEPAPADNDRPEIDRGSLKELLLGSLPAGTVRWGAKVTAVRRAADGASRLTFADGSTVEADLLVGADGAWSRVRPLLSTATPEYTGVSFADLTLSDVDSRHPAEAALVGHGSMFALGDERGLLAQRNGGGRIRVYAALRTPADWAASGVLDPADPAAAKAYLLDRFAGWDAGLRGLISAADGPVPARPITALPVGHRWDRVPGVTLLGDAAHLMSPFAGAGANLAMLDGAELGVALTEHADLESALTAYESALFPRSTEFARESANNLVEFFRPDALAAAVAMFAGLAEESR